MPDPRRVLVVEDDAFIREVLTLALQDEGYDVRAVVQGHQALEVLRTWPAELIVLDLMLPVMDGWTFLRERQREGLAPGAPAMVLTAARQPLPPALREAGATVAMAKPFELEELLAAIERLLEPARTQPE